MSTNQPLSKRSSFTHILVHVDASGSGQAALVSPSGAAVASTTDVVNGQNGPNDPGAELAAKVFDAFDVDRRGVIRVETDAMKHVAASSKYAPVFSCSYYPVLVSFLRITTIKCISTVVYFALFW